ncbi:benzoate/H(+) symporter BenE family transporter [Youhaiella tibetensis]|uniref:Benzoate/H(+) symporter BenE family transporter n=1 Tax=Paradevosia tibetensis TaxID=1447062 RepID=A0A5B9DP25_9HYPH|nr:benzoate/H(+) symporter BenE family transporter [Youhaiella tibetensis]QEE20786.1 benzoate/H(+) symporter BenE family transporter [Youhaiella tibetensis]
MLEQTAPSRAWYVQPLLAGLLASVVGYASTFTLVLAGLTAVGATPAQAGSGLFAVCIALGLLNIAIAWRTRIPVSVAWSTPGVAFLATVGGVEGGFPAVVGAFIVTAALIVLAGVWKPFSRAVSAIPAPIANAMLAGILLTLCIAPLRAVEALPLLTLPVVAAWVVGLAFFRRYAVPVAVAVAFVILALNTHLQGSTVANSAPALSFVFPVFTLDAFVRVAIPLFIITMASQNLPGLAVMKANGYELDPAPAFSITGIASAIIAPFGAHTVNLAAITAAICAGPEAHPDPARRWVAPVAAGVGYLIFALGSGLAAALIAASPQLLIQAVAGLALMSSLAQALSGALAHDQDRLPAVVTFVTAASGVTIFGIGAAFWGIVAGILLTLVFRLRR